MGTSEIDGKPNSKGPNDDRCDSDNKENDNNVNPQCGNCHEVYLLATH